MIRNPVWLALLLVPVTLMSVVARASIQDVRDTGPGVEYKVDATHVRVVFVSDRIVRVTATQNDQWSSTQSLMRVADKETPTTITSKDERDMHLLKSKSLTVVVNRKTGALTFRDATGRELLREHDTSPRSFERVAVIKSVPDPATIKRVQTVDGERQVAGSYVQSKDRDAWKGTARFRLADNEALYGLGFDETTDLDLRGKTKRLYQHNLRIVIPFIVSTRGYGLLFDSYSALTFADGKDGTAVTSDVVDDLDYYFVLGPSMDEAIEGYRELTGAATMLPRWAYGYVQSKERYKTQDELIDTVKEFRRREIPLDVIVQDWNYWQSGRWGSPVPEASRYPDIGKMTDTAHNLGAHVMISVWPNPSPQDPPGRELHEGGYTSAGTDYVDFFRRDAADVYFRNIWKYLGQHGIDAWWCDSTEPEVADWKWDAERVKDADDRNILGLSRVIDPQLLNAYALVDSQSLFRNWRNVAPDKRMVNLTRSGYAGSQATGAIVWTGDTSAKWQTLSHEVVAAQSYSASGTPYITSDTGGFFVHRGKPWFWNGDYEGGVDDLAYRELYARWLQFETFLPMFRSHGTDTPREPWNFGEPGTPFFDAILQSIQLRYRLLPFIYSQAGLVYLQGASFVRPVAFGFSEDPRTYDLKTQMLFGDRIMVSPITTPMYYTVGSKPIEGAAKTREIYLPKGAWVDFWTGRKIAGGKTVTSDAPISQIPLHVRAGSVIPMGPIVSHASEQVGAPIELRVYPGADGEFTLYEDAGEGWGYERGEYSLIRMQWKDAAKELRIGKREGSFPGMNTKQQFNVVVVGSGDGVGVSSGKGRDVMYEGNAATVSMKER
jgi:alpha-D-xyloside xylohydrolase